MPLLIVCMVGWFANSLAAAFVQKVTKTPFPLVPKASAAATFDRLFAFAVPFFLASRVLQSWIVIRQKIKEESEDADDGVEK